MYLLLGIAVLGAIALLIADPDRRMWQSACQLTTRVAWRAYAMHLQRRGERAMRWINAWRVRHHRFEQREWRAGIRGSREYGIIARNMEVFAYGDGVWIDRDGGSGSVPSYVAAFARDFDDGLFPDLVGSLIPVKAMPRSVTAERALHARELTASA
jgi:hypothetical protein